ncbi:MAG: hypothetical protein IKN64_12625 [Desulfovibrio sp.]|nr:hypothetical protein [Desulfovibrio sp.]
MRFGIKVALIVQFAFPGTDVKLTIDGVVCHARVLAALIAHIAFDGVAINVFGRDRDHAQGISITTIGSPTPGTSMDLSLCVRFCSTGSSMLSRLSQDESLARAQPQPVLTSPMFRTKNTPKNPKILE